MSEQISAADLARLVVDVRAAQTAYFKGRTKELLVASKQKERELDEIVKRILRREE